MVELYFDRPYTSPALPFRTLQGFRRIHLGGGESKQVSFSLEPRQLAFVDEDGKLIESPGKYTISVGGRQPGTMNDRQVLQAPLTITGQPVTIE